ncbi:MULTISPECIES: XRE family transcriptional regulator [Microbacterium]|uniref:XRE family transcriptional regulator n=1 Tax=Microbacterium TaxID=33882 RepID=UPI000A6EA909|nr:MULTISPECIES: XRE family transcriptional regulator [Microbacterium]
MTTDLRRAVALTVRSELVGAGRTVSWLAEQTGIAPHVLQKQLAMQLDFTVTDLAEIAGALSIDVARLVPRSADR